MVQLNGIHIDEMNSVFNFKMVNNKRIEYFSILLYALRCEVSLVKQFENY